MSSPHSPRRSVCSLVVIAWLAASLPACGGRPPAETTPAGGAADFIAPEEACADDADCVISDFPGCCACCPCSYPYAIRADAVSAERQRCDTLDCTRALAELECEIEECEGCPVTEEHFLAVCSSGRCVPIGA